MADKKDNQSKEEEKKIPVFAVLKNGSVLKNIFLLDKPPAISEPKSIESVENNEKSNEDNDDEILLVGRHPDCNIMLEHPSISRFHLQIHSKPSFQKLSVMDLSSAHGTWVSERKIEPQIQVGLNEGDTLRLGASTRIYRLHWLPISRAFDIKNPLTSPSDVVPPKEIEEEKNQDENSIAEAVISLVPDENSMPFVNNKHIPSAPPMPETMNSSFSDEEELSEVGIFGEVENLEFGSLPGTESVNSSLPVEGILSEAAYQPFDKENQSPEAFFAPNVLSERNEESPPLRSEQKRSVPSLWSRRGKPASVLEVHTSRSRRKNMGVCIDAQAGRGNQQDIEEDSISKVLFSGSGGEEEELFAPDKENFNPNTLLLKSLKKFKAAEIKNSKLNRPSSSKVTLKPKPNINQETVSLSSDNENVTPKVLQERKSERAALRSQVRLLEPAMKIVNKRAERVPFQTLPENSTGKNKSEISVPTATMRSSDSVNCSQTTEKRSNPSNINSVGEARRRWNMVVDTSCLLNKESRRSLKLLQGLKGTQLIIPRMVIRELDCLKRRGSLFRRVTEVSSVLEWIEECMVKTKWWIHVQNSMEEGMPIAPTPPASPHSRFSEGSGGFGTASSVLFSSYGSLMEIVSPTSEDHILECALLFKKIKNDEQFVLLTNNVTLKIKALAEGLICETAEEFRESLVNPYSERFLWVESTPRGPTWSCVDDVVLKENFYHCPIKKTSKAAESAKGLRLILFHNSLFGQINSVN